MSKLRLDQFLVSKNIFESRSKAQAMIMAGKILVNEQKITKAGTMVAEDSQIRLLGDVLKYVSRGGLKLEGALKSFQYDPAGKIALDIGASTGGFTDCLLQHGAKQVVAIDVGYNQLDWKVRNDPRVTVIEKCNFRYLTKEELIKLLPKSPPLFSREGDLGGELAVIDVSFISLDKILPPLYNILSLDGKVIALVKPQFEAERNQVGKGGIIKDSMVHQSVMFKMKKLAVELGYEYLADDVSAITGTDGNKEFFIYLRKNA